MNKNISIMAIPGIAKLNNKSLVIRLYSIIEKVLDVKEEELKSKSRIRKNSDARKMFFNYLRENTSYSLTELGSLLNRDHATVIHCVKTNKIYCDTDKAYRENYEKIKNEFNNKIINYSLIEEDIETVGFNTLEINENL